MLALGTIRTVDRETREDHDTALGLVYTVHDGKVTALEAYSSYADAVAAVRSQLERDYARLRSGRGLVAHPVFKTGRPWQPHGWMVRFHRRSVAGSAAPQGYTGRGSARFRCPRQQGSPQPRQRFLLTP